MSMASFVNENPEEDTKSMSSPKHQPQPATDAPVVVSPSSSPEEPSTSNDNDEDDERVKEDQASLEDPEQQPATTTETAATKITEVVLEDLPIAHVSMEQRDFDENPTELYLSLMRKDWSTALQRAPAEAHVWIYRREADSDQLRWKLLPLHAAIIFHAPLPVIQALLLSYPSATACKDDQGMVPLHLAIRMASSTPIIECLVQNQPAALQCADRKGRTPLVLAAKSPHKSLLVDAMNKAVSGEPMPDYQAQYESLQVESAQREQDLQKQITTLQKHKDADAMVIDELERQLIQQEVAHAERLQTLEQLQAEHAELQKTKTQTDNDNKAVLSNLVSQVGDLQSKLLAVTAERDDLLQNSDVKQADTDKELSRLKTKIADLERQLGQITYLKEEMDGSLKEERRLHGASVDKVNSLQLRCNELHAENARIEAKLEEVTVSEQELAWQKEALTTQLKDTSHQVTIRKLEAERQELRGTVDKLSVKLYKVVGFLDEMVQEQEDIIKGSMSQCSSQDAASQIMLEEGGPLCAAAVKAVSSMNSDTSERQTQRSINSMMNTVNGMKDQINAVIDSVVEDLPQPTPTKKRVATLQFNDSDEEDTETSLVDLGSVATAELGDEVKEEEEKKEDGNAAVLP